MGASRRLSWVAGLDGLGGLGHGVPGEGQVLGLQEEGPLEEWKEPLGENWAEDRPELEQGAEEAGRGWREAEWALAEGALGVEGPTWRWVR